MPSLRESQGIKKDVSGNRNAKKLPIKLKWDLHCATKKGSILQNKKDYPSIVSFLRRWRDLNCPPRNIVAHFPSLRSVVALLISRSFGLPPPATGSGRPLLPRHRGASGSILQNKKDYPSIVSFLRRWRDLNPRATLMTYTLSRGTSSAS